ncbi:MAG: 3D domain-containing protein [Clostridia bacterium]|nr:3D domain-containing protein [Clostridia bacterium]
MKKAGDSCSLAKQITAIAFVMLSITLSGVIYISNCSSKVYKEAESKLGIIAYEEPAYDMPVKMIDESGNIIASSTGFAEGQIDDYIQKDEKLDEKSKQAIDNVFNGTYIKSFLTTTSLNEEKKDLINSFFENNLDKNEEDTTVLHVEEVEEEQNIIIPEDSESGEELISVDQVNTNDDSEAETPALAPGQESVWLYEESQVPDNYITYYDMTATAYCLCKKCTGKTPGSSGYGRTASGLVIKPGTSMKVCAVNRNQIPLGTHIYVQGLKGAKDYGYAIAADTGGAITTNRIDLYFDNHSTCLQWGRRSVRVYILPEE